MNKLPIKQIDSVYSELSKSHKKIADFISENYDKAAYMTAAKMGEMAGVSESTVVRFATELGYDGYPALQDSLQEIIRSKLTSVQRMMFASGRIDDESLINQALESDIHTIRSTLEQVSRDEFYNCISLINKARKIYIMGVRSSAALASFMAYYFNLIYDNVVLVNTSSVSEMLEQIFRISPEDVCIAISFPRYSRQLIKALEYAKDRGVGIISITDSHASPIAALANHILLAKSTMVSFVDSLVAPLSLINALIAAAARGKSEEVYNNLLTLENVWDAYHVYDIEDGENN